MNTQTIERKEVLKLIEELPDSSMASLGEYIAFLRYRDCTPNAETIAAIEEARAGHTEELSLDQLRAELDAIR